VFREAATGGDEGEEVPSIAEVDDEVDGVGVFEGGVERHHVRAAGRRRREEVNLGLLLREGQVEGVRLVPERRLGRGLDGEGLPRCHRVAAAHDAEAAATDLLADDVLLPQRLLAAGAGHAVLCCWCLAVWVVSVLGRRGLRL
jgi:hypothetical protein